jgi:hypothetical protein
LRRFFFSPSTGAAALLLVFRAVLAVSVFAGVFEAVEAGALPAVEAGLGAIYKVEMKGVCKRLTTNLSLVDIL